MGVLPGTWELGWNSTYPWVVEEEFGGIGIPHSLSLGRGSQPWLYRRITWGVFKTPKCHTPPKFRPNSWDGTRVAGFVKLLMTPTCPSLRTVVVGPLPIPHASIKVPLFHASVHQLAWPQGSPKIFVKNTGFFSSGDMMLSTRADT